MHYEIKVEFSIIGFEEQPQEVSDFLGIIADEYFQKNELISSKSILKNKVNGWVIFSGYYVKDEIEKHLKGLFEKINKNKNGFKYLCNKYDSELAISLTIYYNKYNDEEEHNTPALHFDKEIIKLLSELNSEIDIDLYVLSE